MNARADAANAHDLAGHVDNLEVLEQVAPVVLEGGAIGAELLMDGVLHLAGGQGGKGCQLPHWDDDRRLGDDPIVSVHVLRELRKRLQAIARPRLQRELLCSLCTLRRLLLLGLVLLAGHRGRERGHDLFLGQPRVPDVHGAHLREPCHGLSVVPYRCQRHVMGLGPGESVVASRDREARGHALHVVFERTRQCLVEVVQVEQQRSLGRGEHPEVGQVRIATELNCEASSGCVFEVGGHDLRRTSIEREGRYEHPSVTDRHEVLLPGGVLRLEQRDRVRPLGRRRPIRMARERGLVPRALAPRLSVFDAQMLDGSCAHGSMPLMY